MDEHLHNLKRVLQSAIDRIRELDEENEEENYHSLVHIDDLIHYINSDWREIKDFILYWQKMDQTKTNL